MVERDRRFRRIGEAIVAAVRDATPRQTVGLGVLHGFCLDAAQTDGSRFVDFLSHVDGLTALSAQLSRMRELIQPIDIGEAQWRFVKAEHDVSP